ncbi:MAG: ATP-binding cassette domain-containing protein [Gammaproteobacteria bacterium]|nr:ATP-binding cassette domain-containing protein [Gammaproteobacteria bacterium]
MLKLTNLEIRRGHTVLISDMNCQIDSSNRVGVVGRNGCGKSSLFALINGELSADQGDLEVINGAVVAIVKQQVENTGATALDFVLAGDRELIEIESDIAEAVQNQQDDRLGHLYARLEAIDGYNARIRAAKLLQGLGFAVDSHHSAVSHFSGGWRMRLNLAQALMCRSDLLLLDEPTNHLDLDAVLWLEDWLQAYPGTLMLISHDRDFLDKICDHIMHIENKALHYYSGNYSAFERIRAEKLAQQQSAFEKQQREVKHIQSFISRFKAKASKAKQAQSRVKALEKMQLIGPAHVDSPFTFVFKEADKMPSPLIKIEQAAIGYADKIIIDELDFHLIPDDRVGILGHNGAGKSTLMKCLAGELTAIKGEIFRSSSLKIGYFAQHQLEQLQLDENAIYHLQKLNIKETEQSVRSYLGSFGFSGDDCLKPVNVFSGGEKSRLALALIVYQKPNLLILDEPTNHLDIEMRLALVNAIQDFSGALIVVSHDRYLLTAVTDKFYLVQDGQCQVFDGDLDDYRLGLREWKAQQIKEVAGAEKTTAGPSRKEARQKKAELRKQLQPLMKQIAKLDQSMHDLNVKKEALHAELSAEDCYLEANKARLTELLKQQAELDKQLTEAEEQWFNASEQLEALSSHLEPDTGEA